MNPAQRNEHWIAWERRRASIERKWRSKIFTALKQQCQAVAEEVRWNGISAARLNLDYLVPFTGIQVILKALYIKSALLQANVTYGDLKRNNLKFVGFGFNEEWTRAIVQYFELNLLNKAVLPITATTKEQIKKVLEQAVSEGWGVEKTVSEIMSRTNDINRKRANVIVRTESVRAMNVGTLLGADKSSLVMEKQWIDAKDTRERDSHKINGRMKPLEMEDRWPNGLAFPGDPTGEAKEVINCRCTIALVPKRDAQGRPIRKPRTTLPITSTIDQSAAGSFVGGLLQGVTIGSVVGELLHTDL